jgi:chromosome segregation ATPase
MLKVLVDFLASNWAVFLQAPLTFIVIALIGFVAGTMFLKNQNDALKERLNLREDQLKEKDNETKRLTSEVEKVREEKQTSIKNLNRHNDDYENCLKQLSILELSQEAQKMSRKLERSVQLSDQRQDPNMRSFHIETGLYNEWLSEGPKLLAIKNEALKRLPDDVRFPLDQISDSRYTSPAFLSDSVMDAVAEIKSIGLKLAEYNAGQSDNNLSSQPDKSIGADL